MTKLVITGLRLKLSSLFANLSKYICSALDSLKAAGPRKLYIVYNKIVIDICKFMLR